MNELFNSNIVNSEVLVSRNNKRKIVRITQHVREFWEMAAFGLP